MPSAEGLPDDVSEFVVRAVGFGVAAIRLEVVPPRPAISLVIEALAEVLAHGIAIPKHLEFSAHEDPAVIAKYQPSGDWLIINLANAFWSHPYEKMQEYAD
jgi:hypothetical protein